MREDDEILEDDYNELREYADSEIYEELFTYQKQFRCIQ